MVAMVSGVYEQCAVLFNIASLQAQIAKSQNFESDEGIKNACKHFQVTSDNTCRALIHRLILLGCFWNIPATEGGSIFSTTVSTNS